MSQLMAEEIKSMIQEASHAYRLYLQNTNLNTDFAEFAALSYHDFRAALGRPEMTQQQVRRLIRRGYLQAHDLPDEKCWATHVAGYMSLVANTN